MVRGVFTGVVRGNAIHLDRQSGLPDGEQVTVTVQSIPSRPDAGEGLRRAFGGWADDAEGLAEFLDQMRKDRDEPRGESPQ